MESLSVIYEGKAVIEFKDTEAFYNPVQEFNRDLSIAVAEALSATGLRAIRYALEIDGISSVFANDIDANACEFIRKNIYSNNVADKVFISNEDANTMFYDFKKKGCIFNIIDLDPYGSAVPFLDSAIQNISNGGLICVTCTDLAVLCSSYPETCFSKYGSIPVKGKICHETVLLAIRIILSFIARTASKYKRSIEPLLSLFIDFYIRIFVIIRDSPLNAKLISTNISHLLQCKACHSYCLLNSLNHSKTGNTLKFHSPNLEYNSCDICGSVLNLHGPIWNGKLHDNEFLKDVIVYAENSTLRTSKRIIGMITVATEELVTPLFMDLSEISSKLGISNPPIKFILSGLINQSHSVSISHTNPLAIKTSASNIELWGVFIKWILDNKIQTNSHLFQCLCQKLKNTNNNAISFELNPDSIADSKKKSLLRFQENPTSNWGPKQRAGKRRCKSYSSNGFDDKNSENSSQKGSV